MGGIRIDADTLRHHVADKLVGPGPLYRRLAEAIGAAIDGGHLPPDAVLPPERALAAALPASRGTVVAAYGLLADAGAVVRRQGHGTVVRSNASDAARVRELQMGLRARRLTGRVSAEPDPGTLVDLTLAVLDSPAGLPEEAFRPTLDELAKAGRGHGYVALGVDELRAALAEVTTSLGAPATLEEVAVTTGAQQALNLTADLLLSPGDLVVLEEPTHPGAVDLFTRAGARVTTVPTDSGGALPDALDAVLGREPVALVYLVTACSNPAGAVTGEGRRRALAAVLERHGTWLVEDRAFQFLCWEPPPPPVGALLPDRSVVIGSLAKVFWGGLRTGWLRAPRRFVERVGNLRAARELSGPIAPQLTALRLLDDLDPIAEARRVEYRHRLDVLAAALRAAVPDWSFRDPEGGLSLWVRLPAGTGDDFAAVALRHGVAVLPGSAASPAEHHLDRIRVAVSAPEPVLAAATDRLAAAWAEASGAGVG